jgi:integrating conjugative element protein (TIGR03758 family)
MTPDQISAFLSNGGFTPSACATALLGGVFVVLLLWGTWAIRSAYVGWAEQQISPRLFLAVIVRFAAMYLAMTYFLLS